MFRSAAAPSQQSISHASAAASSEHTVETEEPNKSTAAMISDRSDYFQVKIRKVAGLGTEPTQLGPEGEIVSEGEGSFLAYVQLDGKLYWQIGDQGMQWKPIDQDMTYLLPSDSSQRVDVQLVRDGNIENAEVEKLRLEDLQRADR